MNKKISSNISPEEYRELLSRIDLIEITLISSIFELITENLFSDSKILGPAQIDVSDETKHTKKGNQFNITSSWHLSAMIEKKEEKFLDIKASFLIRLISDNDIPKHFWKIYDKSTLPLIIYPYFREFVQNITSRMNVPPLTLPILFR